jgi:hypothetical protein
MKDERGQENEQRVELKYCERCGALGLRECGGGQVYCHHCLPEVEELPVPKRRPDPRMRMPVGRCPVFDDGDYELDLGDEDEDFKAAGGAA